MESKLKHFLIHLIQKNKIRLVGDVMFFFPLHSHPQEEEQDRWLDNDASGIEVKGPEVRDAPRTCNGKPAPKGAPWKPGRARRRLHNWREPAKSRHVKKRV